MLRSSPLVVIVGPTTSGKSALASRLAMQYDGEIIAADSRTIYKGMDIGTAKPSREEQGAIKYHMLDIITPDQMFTAAEFQRLTRSIIDNISSRRKLPILVGGTGLYVDSVIYDFHFLGPADQNNRQELGKLSVIKLQDLLHKQKIALPKNAQNPRHLIRKIETNGTEPKRAQLRENTLVVGLSIDREDLSNRIRSRINHMIASGLSAEVSSLVQKFGWDAPGLQSIGYKELRGFLSGDLSIDQVKEAIIRSTMQYAKRQQTWFKRSRDIIWISNRDEAVDLFATFLSK